MGDEKDDYGNLLSTSLANAEATNALNTQNLANVAGANDATTYLNSIGANTDYGSTTGDGSAGTTTTIPGSNITNNGIAGLKQFVTDNKSWLAAAGALGSVYSGDSGADKKTGYQGVIPTLSASRSMIAAPPTKAQGYRPGAGGIDYGGDVSYALAPGMAPYANLSGTSGSSAGANLTTPSGLNTTASGTTPGSIVATPGGTKVVTPAVVPPKVVTPTVVPPKVVTPTTVPPKVTTNQGSAGYLAAIKSGLTPAQYYGNINQWLIDNPRASRSEIDAIMAKSGVSKEDLQKALETSTFSDFTKYGLTQGQGLQELNFKISDWVRENPYATAQEIKEIMKAAGVNQEDVGRGLNALSASAGKEAAIVSGMGLDQLYKNILDYQTKPRTSEEMAAALAATGLEQRDLDAAQRYAKDKGYAGNPNSEAASYNPLGTTTTAVDTPAVNTSVENTTAAGASNAGTSAVQEAVIEQPIVQDIIAPSTPAVSIPADNKNDIYQYFADPSTQAALAAGDTRSIAETMQALGWSPAEVAAATGSNPAEVQAAYDAALGVGKEDTSYMQAATGGYLGYAEGGMAKGRYLQGETDGMADKLPARIGNDQPAALSHGEFVIPADVVSHMGNGNSDAGAKKLYQMMDKIRMARTGNKKQGKRINPDKFMPGGLAKAFDKGGFTGTGEKLTVDGRPIDHSYVSLSEYQNARGQPHTDYEGLKYDAAGGSRIQTPQGEMYFSPYAEQPSKEKLAWLMSQPTTASLNAMEPLDRRQTLESWQESRPGYVNPINYNTFEDYAGAANIAVGKDEGNDLTNRANFYGLSIEDYNNVLSGDMTRPMGANKSVYGNQLLSPIEQIAAQTARGQGIGKPNAYAMELAKKHPDVFNAASKRYQNYFAKTFPGTLEYESVLKGPSVYDRTGMKKASGGGLMGLASGGSVKHFLEGGTTTAAKNASLGISGVESNLSNWAGPYVTNMLGQGQALANMPYQAYMGQLSAGESPLQTGAFSTASGLTTPSSIGTAATSAGTIGTAAQGLKYAPTTTSFDATQAQNYMNPYLQASLNPQLEEARRQSQITQQQNAAKMTQAGAFGGSRQAILDAETQRNLGSNLANITGTGYNTAYDKATQQFNADQTRKMQEAQYGAGFGLQGLQTGLQAAQAQGALGVQQNQADINNLNAQLTAGGQQRGIESEGIAADKAQFEEARANPYKMVQYQQSLLQGLPLAAQSYQGISPSALTQAAQGASTVNQLLKNLGLIT